MSEATQVPAGESRADPRDWTLNQEWAAIAERTGAVLLLLQGATAFAEAPPCDHGPDGGLPLSDEGRDFARIVYRLLLTPQGQANAASLAFRGNHTLRRELDTVHQQLTRAVWIARGLMEADVPGNVSGHDGLLFIEKEVERADRILGRMGELLEALEVPAA